MIPSRTRTGDYAFTMAADLTSLDELLAPALQPTSSCGPSAPSSEPTAPREQAIQKIGYTHDAMIDLLIAHPAISQNALAARFGYTAAWVSQIMSSDAFQARFAARRAELVDPKIKEAIDAGYDTIIQLSQEHLLRRLAKDNPSDNLVLRSLELSSRARGHGQAAQPTQPGDVHLHLEGLAVNMTDLLARRRQAATIDAEVPNGNQDDASAA